MSELDAYRVDVAACRRRQERLLNVMRERGWAFTFVSQREHVQWLTGVWYPPLFSPVAALRDDGTCLLVAPQKAPEASAADRVLTYEAKWHSTLRNDQKQTATEVFLQADFAPPEAAGATEYSTFPVYLKQVDHAWHDVEPDLYQLRRRKETDELRLMEKAIAATERMYQRARDIIQPGITELEVFNALQSAAVLELGEPLTATGNDYQCHARGGPPRARRVEEGELYILDLGPAFRGYFADNARTIAVTDVTSQQQQAWEAIMQVFRHVESTVRPGKSARELFEEAQSILDRAGIGQFNHHLGHGIGLFPHETPHLNPYWDDTFAEGDVFTVEPGLYAPELRSGMRIENDYRVTSTGVVNLSPFPMELRI